jgi:hypothetical protein
LAGPDGGSLVSEGTEADIDPRGPAGGASFSSAAFADDTSAVDVDLVGSAGATSALAPLRLDSAFAVASLARRAAARSAACASCDDGISVAVVDGASAFAPVRPFSFNSAGGFASLGTGVGASFEVADGVRVSGFSTDLPAFAHQSL